MKLRRAFSVLAGVALLGAIAAYIEITRTTAQPSDRAASSGEADVVRAAAQPSDGVVRSEEPGTVRTAARSADPAVDGAASAGNPLWVLPLKQLSITRDRPIFSPSRRPPPAAPAYVAPVMPRQQAKPAEPERPAVTLLGTIIGEADRLGVFLEAATGNSVKMRIGEDHQGWVLLSVKSREVTLAKNNENVVLELPAPGDSSSLTNPLTQTNSLTQTNQLTPNLQPARRQRR